MAELVQAWLDCRRHKRHTESAQAFEANVERNLCALRAELLSQTYTPGRSICFVVTHPRPREVWAADFRDRVVHHLLYNAIAPRFIASFDAGSAACIPGRGTLYAAERLEHGVRSITQNWSRPAFYLKMDLANFFVAIDKRRLQTQLHKKVTEPFWRWLLDAVLMHDPRSDFELRGDPQLLLRVPAHKRLGAWLNPAKTILQPVARGIDFVGHVIKPWHRNTRPRTVTSAIKRLQTMPSADVFTAGNSYLGLLRQASHSHTDRARIANVLRGRGHAVNGELTKIFRSKT